MTASQIAPKPPRSVLPGRVELAAAAGLAAGDPIAEVLNWGLGLVIANNPGLITGPVASALVLLVSTAVRFGWSYLASRQQPQAAQ